VLAEETRRHAVRDVEAPTLHPSRTEYDLSLPLRSDARMRPTILCARNPDVRIVLDMLDPSRAFAGDDPEGFAVPFLPGWGDIGHAGRVDGGDSGDDRARKNSSISTAVSLRFLPIHSRVDLSVISISGHDDGID
jgi:hypothetical protein